MNVNDFILLCMLIGVALGLALPTDTDPAGYEKPSEREFEQLLRRNGLDNLPRK